LEAIALPVGPAIELVRRSLHDSNSMNAGLKIRLNYDDVISPGVSLDKALRFSAALYQNLHFAAHPSLIPIEGDRLLQIRQPYEPLHLGLTRHVFEVKRGRRPLPLGVDEHVAHIVPDLL